MKNSKNERIKRLRRKRIWPSILGLIFIAGIFAIVLAILIEVSIYDVFKRQVMTNMSQIKPIVDMFEDYEYNESKQEELINYIEGISVGGSVWVSDYSGKNIWANSNKVPNVDKVVCLEFFDSNDVQIIIPEETKNISVSVDGDLVFSEDIIKKIDIVNMIKNGLDSDKEILRAKVWTINSGYSLKVYVLQTLYLFHSHYL